MNIPASFRVDFDQFCEVIREDQKADLIAGVIHMASPENLRVSELRQFLMVLLYGFVQAGRSGRCYACRVAYRLDEENAPEPDLGFIAADRLDLLRENYVDGPPDLAVEIVTPESVRRVYATKRDLYARFGVPEYWIVDPLRQRLTLLRLGGERKYRASRSCNGRYVSRVLPGWTLDPAWLWQNPEPNPRALLRTLLAEAAKK